MKERFTKEPLLAVPNSNKKMKMEVNALDYTIERVLSMKCKDRRWRLFSQNLSIRQRGTVIFMIRKYGSNKRARKLETFIREYKVQV